MDTGEMEMVGRNETGLVSVSIREKYDTILTVVTELLNKTH